MACSKKWEKVLQDYFDGELDKPAKEELLAHIDKCPQCATLLAGLEAVAGAFSALAEEPKVDIAAVALEKTSQLGHSPQGKWILHRGWFRRIFIAAAVIAVLAVFGISNFGSLNSAPASAAEVVRLMNKTLLQLDELEVKVEFTTQRGGKTRRGEMHEILKKPNSQYYRYSDNGNSYKLKIISDGHRLFDEYSSSEHTYRGQMSKFGVTRPMVSNHYFLGQTLTAIDKKIHKEFVKTSVNNRPAYRVKVDVIDDDRDLERGTGDYFEVVQTIWVDRETMLPIKSESVRKGETKPYKTVNFKLLKTSNVNVSLLKLPPTNSNKKKKPKYEWYEVNRDLLGQKNLQMLPPDNIKDWKANYFAVQDFFKEGFKSGYRSGAEYRKGNDLLTVVINPLEHPDFDDRSNFARRKFEGVQYQYVYEGFWFSSLTWKEKNRWVSLDGTMPLHELHQLAMELRGPEELNRQKNMDAARKSLLDRFRAQDEDIIPQQSDESNLESYKIDYVLEYTPYGEKTKTHRVVDIYRKPFDRHLEIYGGTKIEGAYDLFVFNKKSYLEVYHNTTRKIELNGERMPSLQMPLEYGFLPYYIDFLPDNNGPISLQLPVKQEADHKEWGEVKKIGEEKVLGRIAEKYEMKYHYGQKGTVWIDQATRLTLRMEVENRDKSRTVLKVLGLQVNPILNERLFEIAPSYPGEEIATIKNYSALTIKEAKQKAGFKVLVPREVPQGGKLERVVGYKDAGDKVTILYLVYRFQGNNVVLIRQQKSEFEQDWRGIPYETLGGGRFVLTKGIWNNGYWGYKGNNYLGIESTLDLSQTREIIKTLR